MSDGYFCMKCNTMVNISGNPKVGYKAMCECGEESGNTFSECIKSHQEKIGNPVVELSNRDLKPCVRCGNTDSNYINFKVYPELGLNELGPHARCTKCGIMIPSETDDFVSYVQAWNFRKEDGE